MRISTVAIFLQIGLASASALNAQTSAVTMLVDSHVDIYKSGGYDDGTGAASPLAYVFPAGPGQVLSFLGVTGQWTCNDGQEPPYSADGTTTVGVCYRANIVPTGPFSGYDNTDYQGAMVGMFLECGLATIQAPTLRFYFNDGSQGGIKTDFETLQPVIGQVFFVGDGLTGTGSGKQQLFQVPPNRNPSLSRICRFVLFVRILESRLLLRQRREYHRNLQDFATVSKWNHHPLAGFTLKWQIV